MVIRRSLGVAGMVLGVGLVLLTHVLLNQLASRMPFARQHVQPACWVLTRPLPIGTASTPGARIPEGTEFVWDGEVAWFPIIAETGFEPCADPRFTSLAPNPSSLESGPDPSAGR